MRAQARNLADQRCLGDLVIFRRPLVGLVEKLVGLELAFEPDGIQAEMAHVTQLILEPLRAGANEHVVGPTAATDQDVAPIDLKQPVPIRIHL